MSLILERLITSEKSVSLKDRRQTHTFKVARKANKKQIAAAFEKAFGVEPLRVRVVNFKGKKMPSNRFRIRVYHSSWKKAYITVGKEKKIKELE